MKPESLTAEQGVLGCILLNPDETLPLVTTALQTSEAFSSLQHRTIYELLVEMHDKKEAIDLITVQQKLKDGGQLMAIGGLPYLASLPDAVPSAANLDYYLEIVREKHLLRKMVQACTDAIGRVQKHEGDPDTLMDGLEKDIQSLSQQRIAARVWDIRPGIRSVLKDIDAYRGSQSAANGILTGFMDFDILTGGIVAGQVAVIAGRPSVGKSAWALNVVDHVAVNCSIPAGYFSFEMSEASLLKRAIASRARVNLRWLRDLMEDAEAMKRVSKASGKLAGAPLYIDDQPSQNISTLRSKARAMQQKMGIKLMVIDYLQLLHGHPGKRYRSETEELTDVSTGIKELARELKIAVIALSQLNREIEREGKPRKPRMSDLKGSGSVEQDADIIGLLYRADSENRYKPASDDSGHGDPVVPVNMLIPKQRDGQTGEVHFTFLRQFVRFEQAAKIANADDDEQANLPYKDQ